MLVSIIIPTYNEASSVGNVIARTLSLHLEGCEKEIIVVDDGSTDETKLVLQAFRNVQGASLIEVHDSLINMGKGMAVRIGLEKATGDILALLDADGELYPEDLPDVIAPLQSGQADAVFGSRMKLGKEEMTLTGRAANHFLSLLTRVLYHTHVSDVETGMKAMTREVFRRVIFESRGYEWEVESAAKIIRAGFRVKEVPVRYRMIKRLSSKDIGWKDGVKAIYYLLKYRFCSMQKVLRDE